jgi:hypothetical protein
LTYVLRNNNNNNKLLRRSAGPQLVKSVFGSVVAGAFQIAFRAEMHASDVFLFFKNHF